ncbi:hypothetical protein B0H13DRAFT_2348085 [Mycena leptocephala]|nr:hypothetical protein B0H13DRAFT_2348085 [Mycena leptocephala]
MKSPKDDELATKRTLDTINGANDTCSKCATPGGLALLTKANWHRLQIWPGQLLKNRLKHNTEVTVPFTTSVSHISTAGPRWGRGSQASLTCQGLP